MKSYRAFGEVNWKGKNELLMPNQCEFKTESLLSNFKCSFDSGMIIKICLRCIARSFICYMFMKGEGKVGEIYIISNMNPMQLEGSRSRIEEWKFRRKM